MSHTSPKNSAAHERPATSGWPGGGPRETRACATARVPPTTLPGKTPPAVEAVIRQLRQDRKLSPRRLVPLVGVPASTVHAVLTRHGLHRLVWLDRPTGEPVRRYERQRPGELIHVDVKKLGRLRDGGGWRIHGRDSLEYRRACGSTRVGFDYVHCAHRRPHPPGLRRNPPRRKDQHLRRIPPPRRRPLRRPRHHPHRTGHDRQRLGLPPPRRCCGPPSTRSSRP